MPQKKSLEVGLLIVSIILFLGPCLHFSFLNIPKVQSDITTGLVGYWRFDENSGIIAYDSSGQGNNGALMPSGSYPSYTNQSKFGSALIFNQTNYVNCGTNSTLNVTADFTISAWINYTGVGGHLAIMSKSDDTLASFQYEFKLQGGIADLVMITSSLFIYEVIASYIPINVFTFLVATVNGNVMTIYENGILANTTIMSNGIREYSSVSTLIGATKGSSPSNKFAGTIDEVRLYNKSLAQQDITELYNGFNIQSSSDLGVNISPLGSVSVGANQNPNSSYTITNKTGYGIGTLYIDGFSYGTVSSYSFSNVNSNHTIYATSYVLPQTYSTTFGVSGLEIFFIILIFLNLFCMIVRIPLFGFIIAILSITLGAIELSNTSIDYYVSIFVIIMGVINLFLQATEMRK